MKCLKGNRNYTDVLLACSQLSYTCGPSDYIIPHVQTLHQTFEFHLLKMYFLHSYFQIGVVS